MLCLLAKNCTEAAYTRLVEALCTEHNIMLMKVNICRHSHNARNKDQKLVGHDGIVIGYNTAYPLKM